MELGHNKDARVAGSWAVGLCRKGWKSNAYARLGKWEAAARRRGVDSEKRMKVLSSGLDECYQAKGPKELGVAVACVYVRVCCVVLVSGRSRSCEKPRNLNVRSSDRTIRAFFFCCV